MNIQQRKVVKDDNGIALVSVLIVIMLCFLLSATIMRVSYTALLSRSVNTASADNFYDAEGVVDDVRIKLQTVAAATLNVTGASDTASFLQTAYTTLTTGTDSDEVVNAENYLSSGLAAGATLEILGTITKGETTLTISDVHITYVDPDNGFVSEITTDIRICAPFYASSVTNALGTYSMLVGSGATFKSDSSFHFGNDAKPGYFYQEGNVYVGTQAEGNTCVTIYTGATVEFGGDNVVFNGDIIVDEYSTLKFSGGDVEVKGTIYLSENSYLCIHEDTYLLCKDIVIDGKSVSGNTDGATKYNNATSGTAYNVNFPYTCDPMSSTDWSNHTSQRIISAVKNLPSCILVLDDAADAYFQVMNGVKDGDVILKYNLADGSEKEFELVSGKDVERQGIYFDSTEKPFEKITVTTYDGHDYVVDDRFAKLINVDYLYYISKNNSGQSYAEPKYYINKNWTETASTNPFSLLPLSSYYAIPNDTTISTSRTNWKKFTYVKRDGTTVTYPVSSEFGGVRNINGGFTNRVALYFGLNAYTVTFNKGDQYVGIFMSADVVNYELKEGGSGGVSILDGSSSYADANKALLTTYMDDYSRYIVLNQDTNNWLTNMGKNGQNSFLYPWLINNVFVGGTKTFYTDNDLSVTTVDTSQNEELDLIELDNWRKE